MFADANHLITFYLLHITSSTIPDETRLTAHQMNGTYCSSFVKFFSKILRADLIQMESEVITPEIATEVMV